MSQIKTMPDLSRRSFIIGTAAVKDPELVREAARLHPGRIAVGVDARAELRRRRTDRLYALRLQLFAHMRCSFVRVARIAAGDDIFHPALHIPQRARMRVNVELALADCIEGALRDLGSADLA